MPKLATPLTDVQSRTAKPKDKPYKLADGGGLYMLVNTDGAKYWRMDYRFAGTRRTLAFGKYPEVTLAEARDRRLAARKLLDQDVDPGQEKKSVYALCKRRTAIPLKSWRESGMRTSSRLGAQLRRATRYAGWKLTSSRR